MGWIPRSRAALRALHHQSGGAHADDHAVAAAVKGGGGLFDHFVRGRGSTGQEAGAHPANQIVRSDIVGRDHDHAAAPSGADPVLRQSHRLGGTGASGVNRRVRSTCANEFGKLGVPHRQHPEQVTPVEHIRLFLDGGA